MRQALTNPNGLQVPLAVLILWIMLAVLGGGVIAARLHAAEIPEIGTGDSPWEISADRIAYDPAADTYLAEGNVTLFREGSTLTADSVRLDQRSREAWAEGRVRLLSGRDSLTGSRLRLHLDQETGALTNGLLFVAERNLFLSGREIQKTGPATYHLKGATATTCDGPEPDWRITGSDVKVTIEGYGYAKHATLWVRRVPLVYTPYLAFPVKLKRQTGLLTPEVSQGDRKGVRYLQPLFWAISESTDATLFIDHMSERGTRIGAEYRYMTGETAKGTLMADGLQDRRVDDGQSSNNRWGYTDDRQTRPNSDRYWLRAKIDQPMPLGLDAKLDLDLVSDQDYLKEFETGYGGFEYTRDYFRDVYGRDIDDFNDPVRLNQLNLNRIWTGYSFNTDVRWYDDVIRRRRHDTNDTLQQLPTISLDGTRKRLPGAPLYFDLRSSLTHFYREDGTRGQRADLYPRFYYPIRPNNAFFIEPSAGVRQTAWHVDRYAQGEESDHRAHHRSLYDLKLDAGTGFHRVFNTGWVGYDRIRHMVTPRVTYEYIPDQDQESLPLFDDWDRIAPRNRITYALTNTLTGRSPARKSSADPDAAGDFTYTPVLRFKLEQYFDIDNPNSDDARPFSNVLGELQLRMGRMGTAQADALWSPYDGQFYGYNTGVQWAHPRGDRLRADYRFTRATDAVEGLQTIHIAAVWQATRHWQLRGKHERNIERRQRIESGMGISYQAQCWRIDLDYKDEPGDQSVRMMVHLTGLGAFGN